MLAKNIKSGIEIGTVTGWNERQVSINVESTASYLITVIAFDTCRQNYTSRATVSERCYSIDHSTITQDKSLILPTPGIMQMSSGLFSFASPEPSLQCVEREANNRGINAGLIFTLFAINLWFNILL